MWDLGVGRDENFMVKEVTERPKPPDLRFTVVQKEIKILRPILCVCVCVCVCLCLCLCFEDKI
jgi:hypothetical protein